MVPPAAPPTRRGGHRPDGVSFLELFYDLVFVVLIAEHQRCAGDVGLRPPAADRGGRGCRRGSGEPGRARRRRAHAGRDGLADLGVRDGDAAVAGGRRPHARGRGQARGAGPRLARPAPWLLALALDVVLSVTWWIAFARCGPGCARAPRSSERPPQTRRGTWPFAVNIQRIILCPESETGSNMSGQPPSITVSPCSRP
jgi:hypothetical protein